ncbi:DUF2237 domain-containing protein [Glaciecola sp. MH2013]|uniref:DUF2237 family protein n=1 Tax=Glaciecola sp. MH2013 TaxID=2785524 RepID=UPI00189FB00E|nr:DUF2237 domain-containing protein [Glaciecola sp. MH2013]MBF7074099.1 DUF2237 domain-containing protein [Glaciecola sp. MH2013]
MANQKNVLGSTLKLCCGNTGYTREGFCYVPEGDIGNHSVCAIVTEEFLQYSLSRGNDLISPNPLYQFKGLKPGDKWCLCAMRWREALFMEVAPYIDLEATNEAALEVIPLETLQQYSHKNMPARAT